MPDPVAITITPTPEALLRALARRRSPGARATRRPHHHPHPLGSGTRHDMEDLMAVFTTVQAARIPHRCTFCRGTVAPGQRYERHTITPDDDASDGTHWQRVTNHLVRDCPVTRGEQ